MEKRDDLAFPKQPISGSHGDRLKSYVRAAPTDGLLTLERRLLSATDVHSTTENGDTWSDAAASLASLRSGLRQHS